MQLYLKIHLENNLEGKEQEPFLKGHPMRL